MFSLEFLPRSALSICRACGEHAERTWYLPWPVIMWRRIMRLVCRHPRAPISDWRDVGIGDGKSWRRVMENFSWNRILGIITKLLKNFWNKLWKVVKKTFIKIFFKKKSLRLRNKLKYRLHRHPVQPNTPTIRLHVVSTIWIENFLNNLLLNFQLRSNLNRSLSERSSSEKKINQKRKSHWNCELKDK